MKRILVSILSLGLFAGAAVSGSSAGTALDAGSTLFTENCAQCHSATSAETKIGPGLKGLFKNKTLPSTGRPTTVANVSAQIKNGGGGMPSFGDKLDASQISSLVVYLKTL